MNIAVIGLGLIGGSLVLVAAVSALHGPPLNPIVASIVLVARNAFLVCFWVLFFTLAGFPSSLPFPRWLRPHTTCLMAYCAIEALILYWKYWDTGHQWDTVRLPLSVVLPMGCYVAWWRIFR